MSKPTGYSTVQCIAVLLLCLYINVIVGSGIWYLSHRIAESWSN